MIGLFVTTLLLAACGEDEESPEEGTSKNTSKETSEDSESVDGDIHGIGDTVEVESFEWEIPYEVTVNSFEQVKLRLILLNRLRNIMESQWIHLL